MKKLLWLLAFISSLAMAFEPFTVRDIKVEGVQRVNVGAVFNNFPINVGDRVDSAALSDATRKLYASGLFRDVVIERANDVLVLRLSEHPAINALAFAGNNELKTEDLESGFRALGIAPGMTLNNNTLKQAALELEKQYVAIGRYGTEISTHITPLVRNRVNILVNVKESDKSAVRYVRFFGNKAFTSKTLAKELNLAPAKKIQVFGGKDEFSLEKLNSDVELLSNFYRDRGFVDFKMVSHHAELSQDKKSVTITYNIDEGTKFYVRSLRLSQDSKINPKFFTTHATSIKSGESFSRKKMVESTEKLADKLGEQGFAFADIDVEPKKIAGRWLDLIYTIKPGRQTYINRINIVGNTKTRDDVIRRELRLHEGGRFSAEELKRSTTRLRRLGYFENVSVKTEPVAGTEDKIDVIYTIKEKSTGNIKLGLGYSRSGGIGLNFGISQDNFLGSGKRFSLDVSTTDSEKNYSFNIYDPYLTDNGISLGYGLFYSDVNTEDVEYLSSYALDEYGGELDFGVPINEYDRIHIGTRLSRAEFTCGSSFDECNDYIDSYANEVDEDSEGRTTGQLDIYDLFLRWSRDTRNRAIFPTKGMQQSFSMSVGVGDVKYDRFSYLNKTYIPITENFTFKMTADLGYGYSRGIGEDELPFFKRFFAGGEGSVRGFETSSLSPTSSGDSSRYVGGNLKTVFKFELISPIPFMSDNKSIRLVSFVDSGNAFATKDDFDTNLLRVSAGLGVLWISPIGPLSLSYAKPVVKEDGDELRGFQFQLGAIF
jgi:outer membrane protein insertion porin family